MMILPNSEQMRMIDQCAINEFNIPGIVLMENAGAGTVILMERLLGSLAGGLFPIFIGPGNNGGDGLVIARHLYQRKAVPLLVFLVEPGRLKGDSGANLEIVKKLDIESLIYTKPNSLHEVVGIIDRLALSHGPPVALIDSLFGTGLDRTVKGRYSEAIALINNLGLARKVPIVAVDTPSGLSSDSGQILGSAIKADITATYGYAKIGQVLPSGQSLIGDLHVVDIGIPPQVLERVKVDKAAVDRLDHPALSKCLQRTTDSHKGNFGHLCIVGGSAGKTGAALLAARGALRSGSGLVTVCTPKELNSIYESALPEAMTAVVDGTDFLSIDSRDAIFEHLADKTCVVLGPGIGQHQKTAELVLELYHQLSIPMVVDADALNILGHRREDLSAPSGPRILTPHPGEMARLIGLTTAQVQADRETALHTCFEGFETVGSELIIILKGSGTLTTDGAMIWVNLTGNSSMAAGGMGDVLSGLIGSLICQGMNILDAARYAAYLHGYSGDRLQHKGGVGFSASELADELPQVLADVMDGR